MSKRLLDVLSFERPEIIGTDYRANLALASKRGREDKTRLGLRSAKSVRERDGGHLSILIDAEDDFADDGRLPVKGTYDDIRRWLLRQVKLVRENRLTDQIVTIDIHPEHAIHGDSWWVDENGNAPDVTLPLTMELVEPGDSLPYEAKIVGMKPFGRFRPRLMKKYTMEEYSPHLKATGQGNIWVFAGHGRQGSDGINLIPAVQEFLAYAAAALDLEPQFMFKGQIATTDWFGPFGPCMTVPGHPQGGLQTQYLNMIRASKKTEVAGEALDFCVKAGMLQILDYYSEDADRAVRESISFLMDCTSPIVADDPSKGMTGNADFVKNMKSKGIVMINHDSPIA
jgi:nicotinamidase-related amidase